MKTRKGSITWKHYAACTFGFIMSNFAVMGYDHYSLYFMTDIALLDAGIAGTILRFASPNLSATGSAVFYGIASIVFIIVFSFSSVPTVALITALSDDYNERNQFLSVRSIASTICQAGIRDIDTPGRFTIPPKRPLVTALLFMLKNKPIVYLTIAMFLVTLVTQMGNSVAIHYYEHVLHDTSVLAKTAGFGLPIMLAVPILMPILLRKISKRALLFIGFILTVLPPFSIMIFGVGLTVNTVIVLILINRAGRTLLTPCISSLVPECVD
ncbi:MAG: MFS transporter [Lachnospiraceae bacterium]|nr:MFS transporter [Lachnospiraceae bacterium]